MVATRPPMRAQERELSPTAAFERVAVATRELVEQRAELLRLDLEATARRGLRAGVFGALAAGFALIAWLALLGLVFELVASRSSDAAAFATIAAAHGLLAAGAAWKARREAGAATR